MPGNLTNFKMLLHKISILIFILDILALRSIGQQPGGVSGTKVWFVTDKNSAGRYVWKDISGNDRELSTSNPNPLNINFHESLQFNGNLVLTILSNAQLKQITLIAPFYTRYNGTNPSTGNRHFFRITYNNNSTYSINSQQVDRNGTALFSYTPNFQLPNAGISEAFKIASYYNYQTPSSTVWGEDNQRKLEMTFNGYAPEMIIYNKVLNPTERLKVETYLAIKYGITLPASYLGRLNDTLWSIHANQGYNNRITAIGKDSLSGLTQVRSNTSYEEENAAFYNNSDDLDKIRWERQRSLTIGFKDRTMSHVKNGEFIFWGDNGEEESPTTNVSDQSHFPGLNRIQRQWKLLNAYNNPHSTNITMSGKLLRRTHRDKDSSSVYFLLQTSKDFNQIIKVYPMNSFDAVYAEEENDEEEIIKIFQNYTSVNWEGITWSGTEKGDCYFTFGKAPRLEFASIEMCRGREQPAWPKRCVKFQIRGGFPNYRYTIRKDVPNSFPITGIIDSTGGLTINALDGGATYILEITDTNITDSTRTQKIIKRFKVNRYSIVFL